MEEKKIPRAYLHSDVVLGIIWGEAKCLDLLQQSVEGRVSLVLSDFALYEAFAALDVEDEVDGGAVALLIQQAELVTGLWYPKNVKMTPERKAKLREGARQISCT